MKTLIAIVIFTIMCISNCFAQAGNQRSGWKLVFQDNFWADELDETKWMKHFPSSSGCVENQEWWPGALSKDKNIKINNKLKQLELYITFEPEIWNKYIYDTDCHPTVLESKQFDFTMGAITSKRKFKYGLFEVSCKLPKGKKIWPALWLYGGDYWNEVDIFEIDHFKNSRVALGLIKDYNKDGKSHTSFKSFYNNNTIYKKNNTYIFYWKKDELIFNRIGKSPLDIKGNTSLTKLISKKKPKNTWGKRNLIKNYKGYFTTFDDNINGLSSFNQLFPDYALYLLMNTTVSIYKVGKNNKKKHIHYSDNKKKKYNNDPFIISSVKVYKWLDCDNKVNISNYDYNKDGSYILGGIITFNCPGSTKISNNKYLTVLATQKNDIKGEFSIKESNTSFQAKIINCSFNDYPNYYMISEDSVVNTKGSAYKSIPKQLINIKPTVKTMQLNEDDVLLNSGNVKIYPNPSNSIIIVELPAEIIGFNNIEVFNNSGNRVYINDCYKMSYEINFTGFSKGIYYLLLNVNSQKHVYKILYN